MKNIVEKYKALTTKHQLIIAAVVFVLVLILLPNIVVYAASAIVSYKIVNRKVWKYAATTAFCFITFFSAILWMSRETSQVGLVNNTVSVQATQNQVSINEAVTTSTGVVDKTVSIPVSPAKNSQKLFDVVKVVDGDTLDVSIDGKTERLRLIGINTPETVDPRKPVECFGIEASNKAKSLLSGKQVALEGDSTQGERDKYERLLRYVFLEDRTNFNLLMIKQGYAYEYTYDLSYKYQAEFKQAQKEAMNSEAGLWGDVCQGKETSQPGATTPVPVVQTSVSPVQPDTQSGCIIKGNISSTKEKIYHMSGCGSYAKTVIDESAGERWFCSEQEALSTGWRKALNCN